MGALAGAGAGRDEPVRRIDWGVCVGWDRIKVYTFVNCCGGGLSAQQS